MSESVDPTLPLIRTKLAPPRIGSASVERRALLETLAKHHLRRLHLLVGPAGSGKTSVLVQWRKQRLEAGDRVAWYSAGADDDELRVAAYLVEALRHAGMDIGNEGLQLFLHSGGSAWQHLLASLVNDCADAERETYLVIDNFQHLSSFAVLQLLNRWIALAPPTLHFVIATRVSPPLELARLRAEGQLVELGFDRLRFDVDETRRFVESQGVPALDATRIINLHGITDGWPAGLQLLTFSIRKDQNNGEMLQRPGALSMNQAQALDDYLAQNVVDLLQAAELDFLTRISILHRFNRPLCEAVSGDARAGEYLRKFEAENLFLLPIDTADEEPWYRFHPLFASFLEKRLRKFDAKLAQQLHRSATHWFAEQQLQAEALRHATRSNDPQLLIDLIDQYARRLTNAGQYFEYLRWCEHAPADLLARHLNASLCLALAQLSCGRLRDFKLTVAGIEQHPDADQVSVRAELQLLNAYHAMRTDDPISERRAMAAAQAHPPPPDSSAGLMLTSIRCHELVYAGDFDAVREAARQRFRSGDGRRAVVPLVDFWVGLSYLLDGRIALAIDQLRTVVEVGQQFAGTDSGTSGLVYGSLLEALYQSDRIDEARELLDQQLELVEAVGLPDSLMYAWRVRARIERLDEDHASALKTLQELEERGLRLGLDRLVAWSLHDQLLLALDTKQTVHVDELSRRLAYVASPWADERGNVRSEIGLAAAMARAELAVNAQSHDESASVLVAAAIDCAHRTNRRMAEIRAQLLRAVLLLRAGEQQQAAELAYSQLQLANSLGMRRIFVDLTPVVRESLRTLAPLFRGAEVVALMREVQPPVPSDAETPEHPLIAATPSLPKTATTLEEKLLTVREREILNLLGRALSVKSIARELNLSPGTVKWHLRNIYGKLGACSKEGALSKVRELVSSGTRAS